MNTSKNYQENESWFVPGWFEPVTEQDKRDAKTLCALVGREQKTLTNQK